jgi:hypothetical protein
VRGASGGWCVVPVVRGAWWLRRACVVRGCAWVSYLHACPACGVCWAIYIGTHGHGTAHAWVHVRTLPLRSQSCILLLLLITDERSASCMDLRC